MALLSEPDFVWQAVALLDQIRIRKATGEIVARVRYVGEGIFRYDGTDYYGREGALRACEAKYPSGENFT